MRVVIIFAACISTALLGCRGRDSQKNNVSDHSKVQVPGDTYRLSDPELRKDLSKAQGGDSEAAYRLSLHYLLAVNNPTEHRRWLEVSARGGHPAAQYSMGYFLSQYGKQEEARVWLESAIRSAHRAGDDKTVAAAERLLIELRGPDGRGRS